MQKNYELLYIVHPDLEGSTDKVSEKVTGFITKVGGVVTSHEDWGKRKLAYPIAKNNFGVYVLIYFNIEPTQLHEVERDLRLSEEIMRSMVVVVPDVKEIVVKPKKVKAEPKVEKVEAPASIIVAAKKPAKKAVKIVESVEDAETVDKKTVAKKTAAKTPAKKAAPKKTAKTDEKAEAARLKKLDEKLDELLK
jgi:small subunit ribosomal protein S6